MKKRISLFVIAAMIVSLFSVNSFAVMATAPTTMEQQLSAISANDDVVLSSSDSLHILSQFPAEISYVEDKYDLHIETLNEENLTLLKREAIQNLNDPNYKFSDLMDAIAIACAGNRGSEIAQRSGDPTVTITTYRPFGPLRGEFFMAAPIGTAKTEVKTGTVSISSGSDLYGIKIEANISKSVSYTCQGPADGTKLYNGQLATHRMAFGVLYGTIIKHIVSYPGGSTHVFYYVEQATMDVVDYTSNIQIGASVTYSDTLKGTTLRFSNQNYLYSAIREKPAQFLPA